MIRDSESLHKNRKISLTIARMALKKRNLGYHLPLIVLKAKALELYHSGFDNKSLSLMCSDIRSHGIGIIEDKGTLIFID